jgi:hypothetical protein
VAIKRELSASRASSIGPQHDSRDNFPNHLRLPHTHRKPAQALRQSDQE